MANGAIMNNIFVSYRRSDSSDVTGRIFDQLKARFGEERLFKDVDSIPLGRDFRTVISEMVGQCEILLAVIGKDWLKVTDDDGRRRIDNPNDYVHIEIATALNRGIPVIPVLVENTLMPRSADLPVPLRDLAFRNSTPVRSDPDFHHDIDRLCSQLEKYLPKGRAWRPAWVMGTKYAKYRAWVIGVVCIFSLFHMIGFFQSTKDGQHNPSMANTEKSAPIPIRFWIVKLPEIPGEDARKLFSNALGSWQAIVATPITEAESREQANVIITTDPETRAVVSRVGPPTSENSSPITIYFGSTVKWSSRTFEAASSRMLGHILGLEYTNRPGQLMTNPEKTDLDSLPLTPQADDIRRIVKIWGN